MNTINFSPSRHGAPRLVKACDEAARLFFGESFDDYAASVLTYNANGSVTVSTATGRSTWDALRNAAGSRETADPLASLFTSDTWSGYQSLEGPIRYQTAENADGVLCALIFKR